MATLKDKLEEFSARIPQDDPAASSLLQEMREQVNKLESMRQTEDPRLSFTTPEFKEAQRTFTENLKNNFNRPVEWRLVKDYPWSTPQLRKIEKAEAATS